MSVHLNNIFCCFVYSESQWKTIKKVLKNSASAAAPSLAAVAAAVVGLLLL